MSRLRFLSTPSARRATPSSTSKLSIIWISIHALREEGDGHALFLRVKAAEISIHALREEGDCVLLGHGRDQADFYPRPPRGGRPGRSLHPKSQGQFLSTPSARRATQRIRHSIFCVKDFYPRPPRGGRPCGAGATLLAFLFLSTPSARRATLLILSCGPPRRDFYPRPPRGGRLTTSTVIPGSRYFYPRPPRGGRPEGIKITPHAKAISIHALREEGDLTPFMVQPHFAQFLSTPSARRATGLVTLIFCLMTLFLSTPSARRATPGIPRSALTGTTFLSTPSARRATYLDITWQDDGLISIHALREEGDPGIPRSALTGTTFLSTPSARRATASIRAHFLLVHYFYPRPPRGGRRHDL